MLIISLQQVGCERKAGAGSPPDIEPPDGASEALLVGQSLWVDSTSSAWAYMQSIARTDAPRAAQIGEIARQPLVPWFTDPDVNLREQVNDLVTRIRGSGAVPLFVLYAIPQRDCGSFASGGAKTAAAYRQWIAAAAEGIGTRRAVVILEPDALNEIECLSAGALTERFTLLRDAVATLKRQPATAVYLDAGNVDWATPAEIAARLKTAGIDQADGFALNISNFFTTADNIVYGRAVSARVGGKHFIIDTSRNGKGLAPNGEWCNPAGRSLGERPTTSTGDALVDAFLWVKTPGESDGECNGGPRAGEFWPEYALQLLRNR